MLYVITRNGWQVREAGAAPIVKVAVASRMTRMMLNVPRRQVDLSISTLGAHAVARGAALAAADAALLENDESGVVALG